jgi:hypothetical protein
MTVTLHDRDLGALYHIASNLRARDREEIFATRYTDDPDDLAKDTFNSGDFQWIAYHRETPVASIGAVPVWPGVWSVWAYGTDDWPKVALTLSKHAVRFMRPGMINAGGRRAQCHALQKHTQARKWLERMGFRAEATLDNFGKNGQTFVLYSWTTQKDGNPCA